jgi:hypothetical protein
MAVRNFSGLKIFALLVFSIELLAPVVLTNYDAAIEREDSQVQWKSGHNAWGTLVSLLCEEAGSEEEREGKDHKLLPILYEVNFVAVLQSQILLGDEQFPELHYYKLQSGRQLLSFISTYRI